MLEIRRRRGRPSPTDGGGATGHLPGAHLVDFDEVVGERTPTSGDNPLPSESQLARLVEHWGIGDRSRVVVYSRDDLSSATRVWWVLSWAGLRDVQVLDGGLDAWRAAGGGLSTVPATTGGGDATIRLGSRPTLDADEAAQLAGSGTLIDGRGRSAYQGALEDPAGAAPTGHIPGAINIPGTDHVTGGRLLQPAALRELYAEHLDDRSIGVYCGSGVAATVDILALEVLGVRAALYPGSWSAWITDPQRPVAKGDGEPTR